MNGHDVPKRTCDSWCVVCRREARRRWKRTTVGITSTRRNQRERNNRDYRNKPESRASKLARSRWNWFKNRVIKFIETPHRVTGEVDSKYELVGCSVREFAEYLLEQLGGRSSLEIGGIDWKALHFDHIRPLASFDFLDTEQIKCCMNWRNVQLLTNGENRKKSDKYTAEDEQDWVIRMLRLGWEGELYLKHG